MQCISARRRQASTSGSSGMFVFASLHLFSCNLYYMLRAVKSTSWLGGLSTGRKPLTSALQRNPMSCTSRLDGLGQQVAGPRKKKKKCIGHAVLSNCKTHTCSRIARPFAERLVQACTLSATGKTWFDSVQHVSKLLLYVSAYDERKRTEKHA